MSFDLTIEPWLPVVDKKGHSRTVGLTDVLLQAHELRWLNAEAPPMTAALHRLLLALSHRVYGPATKNEWKNLWRGEGFPEQPLIDYFENYSDRFDLFHPTRPFLQCPQLASLKTGTAAQLVQYRSVGSNRTLFDQTTAEQRPELAPDVAARWLVTLHAYDPGGLKTAYAKDRSSERGPCNPFGMVLVEGNTLQETLLLNMPVYSPSWEKPRGTTAEDHPQWEQTEPPGPHPEQRQPRGWTDLLTWPARRVLLHHAQQDSEPVVDGVVITPGTRLDTELHEVELMAAFRRRVTGTVKKKNYGAHQPVILQELRGVWRHSRELLLADTRDEFDPKPPFEERARPRVLEHVSDMEWADVIPEDAVYTLRVFGQRLDSSGGGSVETWLHESVPAPVALLRARDSRIGHLIGLAVGLADDAGTALETLRDNYRDAFGAYDSELQRKAKHNRDLEQEYWPRLTAPFARLLHDLATALRTGDSEKTLLESWKRTVHTTATQAADRWAERAPRTRGRQLDTLGALHGRFLARLSYLCRAFDVDSDSYLEPGEEQ